MRKEHSLCPHCLRPAFMLDRGLSFRDERHAGSGTLNITRTRDDQRYGCHGCGNEFNEPIRIGQAIIDQHFAYVEK